MCNLKLLCVMFNATKCLFSRIAKSFVAEAGTVLDFSAEFRSLIGAIFSRSVGRTEVTAFALPLLTVTVLLCLHISVHVHCLKYIPSKIVCPC